MLSDGTIRALLAAGRIRIEPLPADAAFQPASVDLRLGRSFVYIGQWGPGRVTDATPYERTLRLAPYGCALGCTAETVTIPDDIVARVEGKSTWGRRFLQVHSTAGFIDPGFTGQITLELKNLSAAWLSLPIGAPIAQISFQWLDAPAVRPYGSAGLRSHYQGQTGATLPAATP